ncbi:MAG TPA: universal stress protein [Abditibacteriaceae bacterium]|jgi:nucleotide-binding universal stress UspA family protein
MYQKVLIALENSATDEVILCHIEPLIRQLGSEALLAHVADGWGARHFERLGLAESEEMKQDRLYLEQVATRLRQGGITTEARLLLGEPADELIKLARESGADLIAMSTHGHRFLSDMIYGTTVDKVRHTVDIPVLLLKAPRN